MKRRFKLSSWVRKRVRLAGGMMTREARCARAKPSKDAMGEGLSTSCSNRGSEKPGNMFTIELVKTEEGSSHTHE